MNTIRRCMVGRDDDNGWLAVIIAIIVVMIVCAVVIYGGAFVGAFYSLKNYVLAFKHNVIDANRKATNNA